MAKTKIKVRPHYRNGQYIASYLRSHTLSISPPSSPTVAGPGSLAGVAQDALNAPARRTSLVDRNGKFFDLTEPKVVIENADFSGYNFDGLNVNHMAFVNSNISGAKFTNCQMENLNLKNSNFTGAKFENCSLFFSSVVKTSMNQSEFIGTSLNGPYSSYDSESDEEIKHFIRESDFSDATFKNSKISRFKFEKSDLQGMKLENSEVTDLTLWDTKAAGLIVNNSSLSEVIFEKVDLSGSLIQNSKITGSGDSFAWEEINMENAVIKDSEINNVKLRVEYWRYTNENYYTTKIDKWWKDRKIRKKNERIQKKEKNFCNNLQISGSTFNNCAFQRPRLANTKIENSKFINTRFMQTDMRNLNVSHNSFEGSKFSNVQGGGLQAEGTNFSGATFGSDSESCDLQNSNFSNAIFDDATIGNTNVRGSTWKGAKTNNMHVFKIDDAPLTVVESSSGEIDTLNRTSYEHYSLRDAAEKMGGTDKAFEFLVVSGAVDVRHNLTKQRIKSDFDPSMNHIPVWQMQNLPNPNPQPAA